MLRPLLLVALLPAFAALTLLALLQGLTEFLPISSSGHLVLAQQAMGLEEPAIVVDVALHVGTLAAVLVVYRRDVGALVRGLFAGEWREPWWIVLGTLPAVAVALFWRGAIEEAFGSVRVAAWGLVATSLLLGLGERARRRRAAAEPARLGWRVALAMGVAQAAAICPGVSRSGSTIAVGLLLGLAPAAAARFSFLLAIPAILGAAVLQLPGAFGALGPGTEGPGGFQAGAELLWAVAFAGFVGWGALRMLLAFLGRGAFAWFALYCAALGAGVLAFGS